MYWFIRIQFDIIYPVPPLFFSSPIWTVLNTFMPFRSPLKYHCLREAFPQHIPKSKLIVAFSCSVSFIAHLTLLFISFLVLFLHRNSLPLVLPPPARCLQHRWRFLCVIFCSAFVLFFKTMQVPPVFTHEIIAPTIIICYYYYCHSFCLSPHRLPIWKTTRVQENAIHDSFVYDADKVLTLSFSVLIFVMNAHLSLMGHITLLNIKDKFILSLLVESVLWAIYIKTYILIKNVYCISFISTLKVAHILMLPL